MKTPSFIICITVLFACQQSGAQELANGLTNAPASIELRDQFDVLQRLSFPATNVTILTIADHKGSQEVDGWIKALKPIYAGRVDFRGLADVEGVPGWVRARVRARFQQTRRYPVMLDWSGNVCARFGYTPGAANILILDPHGVIRARFRGSVSDTAIASARAALEAALLSAAPNPNL